MCLLISLSHCSNNIEKVNQFSELNPQPESPKRESGKTDTFSFCSFNLYDADFTDTSLVYTITHYEDEQKYTYKNLKRNWRTDVYYDSLGVNKMQKIHDELKKEVLIDYNTKGKVQRILINELENDSLQEYSVEDFIYADGQLKYQKHKFNFWLANKSFSKEQNLFFKYDAAGRIQSCLVESKGLRGFSICDTLVYFYEGSSTIPYEVHRKHENFRYYISQTNFDNIKIQSTTPNQKGGLYKNTVIISYDKKQRITEYYSHQRMEPSGKQPLYMKYVFSYSNDAQVPFVPNLLLSEPVLASAKAAYVEAVVNTGCYNEANIHTSLEFYEMMESKTYSRSSDGKHWEQVYKTVRH